MNCLSDLVPRYAMDTRFDVLGVGRGRLEASVAEIAVDELRLLVGVLLLPVLNRLCYEYHDNRRRADGAR